MQSIRAFLISVTRDPVSLAGAAITTASAVIIASLFALELVGFAGSPYIGILAFLVLPAFFLLGLILIPIGMARHRRRQAKAIAEGKEVQAFPVLDFNKDRMRRIAMWFFVLTVVNLVILSAATYKGVEVMESTRFCGQTCHNIMEPEYTAYLRSPHARVACVECHIGPGAPWFVKSKLSGSWQVVAATFNLYPKPVPTPIHNLRPARETCEQCHWPTIFVGDRLKVIPKFAEDEASTESKTVILLRVGGVAGRESMGIHWHVSPGVQIRYRSDVTREKIGDVEMTLQDGTVKLFKAPEGVDAPMTAEWRTMDCVDCHNRPAHTFSTPEQEVNRAMGEGWIDKSLPYIRREGVAALRESYASHDEATQKIGARLATFYRENYPTTSQDQVAAAAAVLSEIYHANVFPAMNVTWGTYLNHLGHESSPGCFRCHDEEHATVDGTTISQDCSTCHSLLAMEEEDPEILKQLEP